MREIRKVILHCSDSDVPAHDDVLVVDRWHRERGWRGVGYHYFIKKDGTLQGGRTLDEWGAHCQGHNSDSVGICLSGQHGFTAAQFDTLADLVEDLELEYPVEEVEGHNHYDPGKTCPNFDVDNFKNFYLYGEQK